MSTDVLDAVIAVASRHSGISTTHLDANSAVDQDLRISGDDVTELAEALAKEFGEHVWQWPWQRFATLDEGLPLGAGFMLVWQLLTWPIRGRFSYPSPYERLELGHIAKCIEAGQWLEL